MNGLDVLAIIGALLLLWQGALWLDEHERWKNRRWLRDLCWAKVEDVMEMTDDELDDVVMIEDIYRKHGFVSIYEEIGWPSL